MPTEKLIYRNGAWATYYGQSGGVPANVAPKASFTFVQGTGDDSYRTDVDARGSSDSDGKIVKVTVDFGNGQIVSNTTGYFGGFYYTAAGIYTIKVTVEDDDGGTDQTTQKITVSSPVVTPTPPTGGSGSGDDFKDGNEPWRIGGYTDGFSAAQTAAIADYTDSRWYNSSRTFLQVVDAAASAKPGVILKMGAGTFTIDVWAKNVSGTFGYALFNKNLGGLLGAGPESTFIRLSPNAITQAMVDAEQQASAPVSFYAVRVDGSQVYSGLTFDGTDQRNIDGPNVKVKSGYPVQPAPWAGLQFFSTNGAVVQNVRFRGFSHCMNNVYPYELGSVNTNNANFTMRRVEIDGRLAAVVNSSRPRRGGGYMYNNGGNDTISDVWQHHTKRSGWTTYGNTYGGAAQAAGSSPWPQAHGTITYNRVRINDSSNVNDGLGGTYTFSCFNHEMYDGLLTYNNCRVNRSNISATGRSTYITLSSANYVGAPDGIRFNFADTSYWENPPATDNGMFSIYCEKQGGLSTENIYWTKFNANQEPFKVYVNGNKLTPIFVSNSAVGSWKTIASSHTAASLSAAGYGPTTHFIVRTV